MDEVCEDIMGCQSYTVAISFQGDTESNKWLYIA